MAARLIRLRYDATCAGCGVGLPAKTSAWWDGAAKATTCQGCGGVEEQPAPVSNEAPPGADDDTPAAPKQIRVRYAGTCASCGADLAAGATALRSAPRGP